MEENISDNNVFLDNNIEEARPLSSSTTHQSSLSRQQQLQKKTTSSFTDRTNKLLHYLVGVTICGAIIVFVPSWMVILRHPSANLENDYEMGTSRIKTTLRSGGSINSQDDRIIGGQGGTRRRPC